MTTTNMATMEEMMNNEAKSNADMQESTTNATSSATECPPGHSMAQHCPNNFRWYCNSWSISASFYMTDRNAR